MKTTIAVTGGTGFLGSSIMHSLQLSGYTVRSLSRRDPQSVDFFSLEHRPSPVLLDGVEILIHAAYDFSPFHPEFVRKQNIDGTRSLYELAKTSGVKKIIHISSISSYPHSFSRYGQTKYTIEQLTFEFGGYVCRPGIIFTKSSQGIIPKLARISKLPLIPIFNGGDQPLYTTHLDDLIDFLTYLISDKQSPPLTPITTAFPKPIFFKEILKQLALAQHHTPRFISIPPLPVVTLLSFMEKLGIHPPLTSDALLGIMHPNPDPDFSLTKHYPIQWRPFDPSIVISNSFL